MNQLLLDLSHTTKYGSTFAEVTLSPGTVTLKMAQENENDDERQPLLPASGSAPTRSEAESGNVKGTECTLRPMVVCVLCLQFLTIFAYFHILAPKLKLLELTICRAYYEIEDPLVIMPQPSWPGYGIDENRCKIAKMQQQLSNIRSWGLFFDGICSTLN